MNSLSVREGPGATDGQLVRITDEPPYCYSATMIRARNDRGETLVEIVLTIVIVGLTMGALLSSLAAAGNAGNAQRRSVQIDYVLRNYAVATKVGVQKCVAANYDVSYVPPAGFSVSGVAPTGNACPLASTTQALTLVATQLSSGLHEKLEIRVRIP